MQNQVSMAAQVFEFPRLTTAFQWRHVCLAACSILACLGTHAQDNRLLPAQDWSYDYIVRLQRRGHLLDLNPTAIPYRVGDIRESLARVNRDVLTASESHWMELLEHALGPGYRRAAGYAADAGTRITNSDRLDTLRPLGDTLRFYWHATPLSAYLNMPRWVLDLTVRHDRYYNDDPDGLDTALRLMARSDHTYGGYHSELFDIYAGRWSNHWGTPGEAATLLSDNARSQDQIAVRLGGRRFTVRALLSELDGSTDAGAFTGRVGDDSVRTGNRRRFLAAHRWDYRPSPRLLISFMESVLYSGTNAGLSLKYMNPVHPFVFVVDNTPKNSENNGFLAGLLWAQAGKVTAHGQLMVDDIRLQRGTGNETVTLAAHASLTYAAAMVDIQTSFTAVTARAYNAPQPEGKYIYLRRGLATQFSDYMVAAISAEFYFDSFARGLRIAPRVEVLHQGQRDIRQKFPANYAVLDNILDGTVERTVRTSIRLAYQPVSWWWIQADGGSNAVRNANHIPSSAYTRFVGTLQTGLRLRLDYAIRL